MKTLTHSLAASIVALAGFLCIPAVHTALVALAAKNSYLAIIVPAGLGVAALYHDPMKTP